MIRRSWLFAAALVLAPMAAFAATEANFDARTTADLVALCEASPDDAMGAAAIGFCRGFAQGAVVVQMQNMSAPRDIPLFCLPNPLPSRADALREFVVWAKASPARMNETATNGLIMFLSERYTCPKKR